MTTTNSQRITRLMAAHEAMVPYWKDGAFNDAPAALASEYADALLGAPASYWDAVDRLDPSVGPAMIAWAQGYIERRDYPEFFAMLTEIGRIRDEQGEEAAAAPEHTELLMKMMHAAPPRYLGEAEAIAAEALPTATHVDEHGRPVYSAQQIADTLGVSVEAIEAGIQHMEDVGFSDGLHNRPVHPIQ
ncbi:hypothetical protein [Simplicispira piscis]|jgi:hypothetical protein